MVEIENLSYSYKKHSVFEALSITFEAGHIYGLLGKNGTGKSTLFRNICGLLKPQKGSILNFGLPSADRKPSMLSKIFLLPEEFFVPPVFVHEFVSTLSSFYPKFSEQEFQEYLTEFDVPTNHKLDQMSMGQKKKTLIAFSLAANTELLLMDEPTNGLDLLSKTQFKKVMNKIVSNEKCIIISTHQVKDIENLIDRISVIDNGKILFNDSIQSIGERISFLNTSTPSEDSELIFSEETLNGFMEVRPNHTGETSKVDLELLYKAVMLKPNDIDKLMNI